MAKIQLVVCFAGIALLAAAQDSSRPQLTARELFYTATNDSAQAKAQPKKSAGTKKSATPPAVQQANSGGGTSSGGHSSTISQPTAPILTAADGIPARVSAPAPTTGTPLGLKYTILKLVGGQKEPIAPNAVFHSGDKIQFSVEANGPGYLYIVSRGSSGTWQPMFPSPEIENGNNKVEGFHTYTFPSGYAFGFDQQVGDEKVFIVLSRDAKPDFEQLVYSLKGAATPASPTNTPRPAVPAGPVLRASVDDSAVGRLNRTYARDLVIERVGDDDTKPDNAEKAVYVVNASGSSDSAVVANLSLVHK